MHPSCWDRPSTLRPVDICAAFPSHSPVHQIDIRNGFHHVDLCDDIYKHPNHKLCFPVPRYSMARGTRGCRQESSLKRRGYRPWSPPGQCVVWGGRSGTTMPIHLTDTCCWRLYDSFNAHSQFRINDTYHRYQRLMHRLSILRGYQSASLGATRSVTGASIGLTPFCSDFIDYLLLDGVTVKDIARANAVLGIGTIMWKLPTTKGHPVYTPIRVWVGKKTPTPWDS